LALYEDVEGIERTGEDGEHGFVVHTRGTDGANIRRVRRARAIALATGYFAQPRGLGVPGESLPWVRKRYREPWSHFAQRVAIIGGGNTAAESALELWRTGAHVTIVHRQAHIKPSVKYWLRPDVENRIAEGAIDARFNTTVTGFHEASDGRPRAMHLAGPDGASTLTVDAVYTLLGYQPDVDFERRCGIEIDDQTLIPSFDPETCETNVPGLYVAGTLQAGRRTDLIFIENARDHGSRIVGHLLRAQQTVPAVTATPRTR
jgi:thioredoxin reductase (NADPH)